MKQGTEPSDVSKENISSEKTMFSLTRDDHIERVAHDTRRAVWERPPQVVRREWETPPLGLWCCSLARGPFVPRTHTQGSEHDVDVYHVGSDDRFGWRHHSLFHFW